MLDQNMGLGVVERQVARSLAGLALRSALSEDVGRAIITQRANSKMRRACTRREGDFCKSQIRSRPTSNLRSTRPRTTTFERPLTTHPCVCLSSCSWLPNLGRHSSTLLLPSFPPLAVPPCSQTLLDLCFNFTASRTSTPGRSYVCRPTRPFRKRAHPVSLCRANLQSLSHQS